MSTYKNCEGWTRRDCLQLGLGMLAGGTFVDLLRARSLAAVASPASKRKPASCILIWMDGGPTHFETFDPKPDAPAEIRGEFKPIATKTPGVYFSQHMTRLASISDKLAVIRSVCHNQGNHGAGNHYMMTGAPPRIPVGCGAFVSFHPSMGAVAAYERGAPEGLPAYFSMPSMSRSGGPNFLGAKYAPFVVGDDPNKNDFRVRDVALPQGLTDDRFHARRDLRKLVEANPKDAQARYELGYRLAVAGKYPEALEMLLSAGEFNPALARGKVREAMVKIFQIIGNTSPLANESRNKLSLMLY